MTRETPVWILTFNRPTALNRLIRSLGAEAFRVNVFSNHPEVRIDEDNKIYLDEVIINTLNNSDSNSWCARSWNTIMQKCFVKYDNAVLIQDDTGIYPGFGDWLDSNRKNYDFILGPVGDLFHYLTKDILKNTGWWDERYIGCYCGDADFLKRVFLTNDRSKLSAQDTHDWGFVHNPCGINQFVSNTHPNDPEYVNQHDDFINKGLNTIVDSQEHYKEKWGVYLNGTGSVIRPENCNRILQEIQWYPSFTKKHLT